MNIRISFPYLFARSRFGSLAQARMGGRQLLLAWILAVSVPAALGAEVESSTCEELLLNARLDLEEEQVIDVDATGRARAQKLAAGGKIEEPLEVQFPKPMPGIVSWDLDAAPIFFSPDWRFAIEAVGGGVELESEQTDGTVQYRLKFSPSAEIRGFGKLPRRSVPQDNNPIDLLTRQGAEGSFVDYRVRANEFTGRGRIFSVVFVEQDDCESIGSVASVDLKPLEGSAGLQGRVHLPDQEGKYWAVAMITSGEEGGASFVRIDEVEVTERWAGIAAGLLVVFLLLLLITLIVRIGSFARSGQKRPRFALFPLDFAVTPVGRYSVSLAQILFWTLIVLFAFVYVYMSRGEALTITTQMLILLGVSGTTSIAAKVNAMAKIPDIPDKYLEGITRDRKPRIGDMLSVGGVPNIFKFQIVGFTLVAGVYVVVELLETASFPELDQNLLVLIGISGGMYVANELATKGDWTKLDGRLQAVKEKEAQRAAKKSNLEKLAQRIQEASDPAEKNKLTEERDRLQGDIDALAAEIVTLEDEISRLLRGIYSEDVSTSPQAAENKSGQ